MNDRPDSIAIESLTDYLAAAKRRLILENVLNAAALSAVTLGLGVIGLMLADWLWNAPWAWRGLGTFTVLLGTVVVFLARGIGPSRGLSAEKVARAVEARQPDWDERLITAAGRMDHGTRLGGMDQLLMQRIQEGLRRGEKRSIALERRLVSLCCAAVAVWGALIIGCVVSDTAASLVSRLYFEQTPYPSRTRIVDIQAPALVAKGASLVLAAKAEGEVPAGGIVVIDSAGASTAFNVDAGRDSTFQLLIPSARETFEFVFRLNDAESAPRRVEVAPPPVLRLVKAIEVRPQYVNEPPRELDMEELRPLVGSVLEIEAESVQPVRGARVRAVGDSTTPEAATVNGRRIGSARKVQPSDSMWIVDVLDEHGLWHESVLSLRLSPKPDRAPSAELTVPSVQEKFVTADAAPRFEAFARDDFGLAEVRWKVRRTRQGERKTIEWVAPVAGSEWNGEALLTDHVDALREGDVYEIWVEARDGNDVSGPGIVESEMRWLKVVSHDRKREELMRRGEELAAAMTSLAIEQERLNERVDQEILLGRGDSDE